MPYEYDSEALALFHCDEQAPVQVDQELDFDALSASSDFEGTPAVVDARSILNARPMGDAGSMKGACRSVTEGRFNGGVRFDGGNGRIAVTRSHTGALSARTVEFWLKLEELPLAAATLVAYSGASAGQVSLQVRPDGALQLAWNKRILPATEFKCPVNMWVHLALEWGEVPPMIRAMIFAGGQEVGHCDFPEYIPSYACPELRLTDVTIGNGPEGKSGIKGTVDEVRLSKSLRRFYPFGLEGLPREPSAGPSGPPFFRESADLLFYAAFNKTLKPDVCAPETAYPDRRVSATEEEFEPARVRRHFQEGVEGQALVVGEDGLEAAYAGLENLRTDAGTIAFRMRPVDWDNYTRDDPLDTIAPSIVTLFHILGEFPEGERPPGWTPNVPIARLVIPQHLSESIDAPVDFSPGLWTHVAIVWEEDRVAYFVNGNTWKPDGSFSFRICDAPQFKPELSKHWLKARPARLCFWDPDSKVRQQANPHTLIDDFRIYRRPLAPAEIANLMALYSPQPRIKPLPLVDMRMDYNGVLGRVDIEVFPLMTNYAQAVSASARVTKEGAVAPLGTVSAAITDGRPVSLCVTTPPLEFSSYRVDVEVRDQRGEVMGSTTQRFTRVKPPWYGSRAGISDKVMPEWTPVKADGNVVSIWGRDIHFSASGIPEKIISAGEDILAGPIRLSASFQGRELPLAPAAERIRITAIKEVRADVQGELRAAQFSLFVGSYIEFDGRMWFTFPLNPAVAKQPMIDQLVIRIPYLARNAELVQ
ncbi:MAG: laminin G domain-containing protein, partial [Planctomycetes bacterium]|nr:laminin G domain-containing protein [Planctomycetota bacterium]